MADQAPNRGRFQKGQPSPNPLGRGAGRDFPRPVIDHASAMQKARATGPAGASGIMSFGGWLSSGESNSKLTGATKWTTYTNAINEAVVATGVRYFGNLLAGTKWSAVANDSGDPRADRGVEIVEQGLLRAPMPKRWPMVVRKAAMYRLLGFSLHATAMVRRADGMVVFSEIAHRPQHTIQKWLREVENDQATPFAAVEQWTQDGKHYTIPIAESLYCVDDTLTDSPEGVGLLRHVIELVRKLGVYQGLEGLGHQSNLGGMPVGRAPLAELAEEGDAADEGDTAAYISAATQTLRDAMEKRNKTPEQMQWLMLDSITYQGKDPNTISGTPKWALDIIRGDVGGLAEINVVIGRLQLEIARVLGIEFAMVGGGETAGSYGMHEDKTSMFATNLAVTLDEVAAFAEPLARRLIIANGLDPDTCTPRLVAEPISTDAILSVTQALANITLAGLAPDDPARTVIRERLRLPPEPDRTAALVAPRMPAVPAPSGALPPTSTSAPATIAPTTAKPAAPAADPTVALNGAQVTSMVDVITAVAEGRIPREGAAVILQVAFNIDAATSERLLGPKGFEPTAPVAAPAPVGKALSDHRDYGSWSGMIQRCTNPDNKDYEYYGGRGIKVCAAWVDDFKQFIKDMGVSTDAKPTINRINNDGDYKPSNCEWSSQADNNRNKGDVTKMLTHATDGWHVYSADGSKHLGGPYPTKAEAVARLAEIEGNK